MHIPKSLSLSLKIWDLAGLSLSLILWDQNNKVSVSVSKVETEIQSLSLSLKNWYHLSKVSVSVSTFETEFTKSQSQSQSRKSGLAHACFMKNLLMIIFYLINISLKDWSFRCGDICKTMRTFINHQFLMYFAHFNKYPPPKLSKTDNYWMTVEFIGN